MLHRPGSRFGVAGFECHDDLLMFGERQGVAARRGKHAPDAVEARSGRFDRALHPGKAERVEQDLMKFEVESVEAHTVSRCGGCPLVAQIAFQRRYQASIVRLGEASYCLRFQGAPDEHALAHICEADTGDLGAALGQDLDQTFALQPGEGFGDRETRHAKALADCQLVDVGAGREIEIDDGFAQHRLDAVRRAAAAGMAERFEKTVGRGFITGILHANMLATEVTAFQRFFASDFIMQIVPKAGRTLRLNVKDNVLVAIDVIEPGAVLSEGPVALQRVPKGHKVAVAPIAVGEPIVKFGQIIGFASEAIVPGAHVHSHNCEFHAFERDYAFAQDAKEEAILPVSEQATFEGYRRPNGKVGTRNYVAILTSVNCSASVARFMADAFNQSGILKDYANIDGVVPFVHGTGCGMADKGEGFEIMKRTQWGYASNPNIAAVLLVGLGCEVFQIGRMKQEYGIVEGDHFQTMTIQDTGGTRKTIEQGIERIKAMLPLANQARRETMPASELVLALQCGGSDGYSGITANPALGAAADILVHQGGTAILSETPEIYGAEHLLTRRAANRAVGEKLVERIKWWENYTAKNNGSMDNNPSPGNKAGGLTTILEKSLGAAAKGGTTTLTAVYEYAEPVREKGFVFMDTPGYDPVSATGQVAGGANILCFTTGRGSAYGCKPTPSIKLATNSDIYRRMTDDMDINCGDVLEGVSIEDKGKEIFAKILKVASGEHSKSEELGYGSNEFVPWQVGATM
jgi:altronate hydrolase